MKVYLDDERPTPEGWVRAWWPEEVITLLQTGQVIDVSLDHDLGDDAHGTGYDVIRWVEEAVATRDLVPPNITVHSANPAGRQRMIAGIESIRRLMRARSDAATPAVDALFARLRSLGIATVTVTHPAVYTVEQAKAHRVRHDGTHVKNLFLRNKKGAMWLVVLQEERIVDLRDLGRRIGAGNVSFGSPDRLRRYLGVEPGSVTPLAVVNDAAAEVQVVIDALVLQRDPVHCHPLTNTMTTAISGADLLRFLRACGHAPSILDLDALAGP